VSGAVAAEVVGTPTVVIGWSPNDPANAADGHQAILTSLPYLFSVAVGPDGSIFLVCQNQIKKIGTDGIVSTALTTENLEDGGKIAADSLGNIYYAGNSIHKITPGGQDTVIAGSGSLQAHDGLPATSAALSIGGLAVSAASELFFSDDNSYSVWRIDSAGLLHLVAGTGVGGTAGEGGPATGAEIARPGDLAFDGSGALYIIDYGSDYYGRVLKVALDGTLVRLAGGSSNSYFYSLAVDPVGDVYTVSTPNQIIQISKDGTVAIIAGSNQRGFFNGCGSEGQPNIGDAATASFASITGLAADQAGDILVADNKSLFRYSTYGVVRQISPSGAIRTIAGYPPTLSGDGGPVSAATLGSPNGLAYDGAGNLYIADTGNNRIRKVTQDGIINTIVGEGGPAADINYACSTGDQDSFLSSPEAVALDSAGNLYIADTGKNRVMKLAPDGTLTHFAGTGQSGFQLSRIGTPAMQIPLTEPRAVGVDQAGNIWIGDDEMRTLKISPAGVVVDVLPRVRPRSFTTDVQGNLYLTSSFVSYLVNADDELVPMAGLGQGPVIDGPTTVATTTNQVPPSPFPSPPVDEPDANDQGAASGLTRDGAGNLYQVGSGLQLVSPACNVTTPTYAFGTGPLNGPGQVAASPQGGVFMADSESGVIWRLPNLTSQPDDQPTPALAVGAPVRNAGSLIISTTDQSEVVGPVGCTIHGCTGGAMYSFTRSLVSDAVSPGEIVQITGQCLGPFDPVAASFGSDGRLPTTLGGTSVIFGSTPAPLISVQAGRIVAIVPYETPTRNIMIVQRSAAPPAPQLLQSASVSVQIVDARPGLFHYLELDGTETVAALNQDGTLNSQAHPAPVGSVVALYATGLGQTNPPSVDGEPAQPVDQNNVAVAISQPPVIVPNLPTAEVLYAGPAPGFAGLWQINVVVRQTTTGPIQLQEGGAPFRQQVLIWIQ
jgi:uncharacterized protein (TIGR03437 family)